MAAGGPSAIIEVEPVLFKNHLEKMVAIVQTAVEKGVGQMQFNVVDEETLQNAQQEPLNYQYLTVRVSGYSQRFVLLTKDLQNHIIARTKHKQ